MAGTDADLRIQARQFEANGQIEQARAAWKALLADGPDSEATERLGLYEQRAGNFEEAARLFESVIAAEPERLKARVLLARLREQARTYDVAMEAWDAALALQPNYEAWERSGILANRLGDADDAERRLRAASQFGPLRAMTARIMADLLERRGSLAEALAIWTELQQHENPPEAAENVARLSAAAAGVDPAAAVARNRARSAESAGDTEMAREIWLEVLNLAEDAEAHERLGLYAFQQGDYGEAENRYRAVIAIAPERTKGRVLLARLLDETAPAEQALEAWADVLALDPNTPEALERCGLLSVELGREEGAIDFLRRALAQRIRLKAVRALSGVHEARGEYDQAIEAWRLLTQGENRQIAYFNLGRLFVLQGDDVAAIANFRSALEDGDQPIILQRLASLLERCGDTAGAEDCWRRALALEDDALARDRLGVLLRDSGRGSEALEQFKAAARLEPNTRRYWIQIARVCEAIGALSDAVDAWSNVLDIADDGKAHERLAINLLKLNRPREALAHIRRAAASLGSDGESWRRIGSALEDAGEIEAAIGAWIEALHHDGQDLITRRRLAQIYYSLDRGEDARAIMAGENPWEAQGYAPWSFAVRQRRRLAAFWRIRRPSDNDKNALQAAPAGGATVDSVKAELAELARGDDTIVIGPWLSELGFEILYWLPFLRWAVRTYEFAPKRLMVISRGGLAPLYQQLGGDVRYVDIFSEFSPDAFRELNQARWRETGLQKHLFVSRADRDVLKRFGVDSGARLLHPRLMYELFSSYWAGQAGFERYRAHVELARFTPLRHPVLDSLPPSFDVAKFYTRDSFQGTPQNREKINRLLLRRAAVRPVVFLNTGQSFDDHGEFQPPAHPNIISLAGQFAPEENLLAQTAIISHAEEVHCTSGGFCYLPLSFGVPVTGYYSGKRHYLHLHGPAAFWTAEKLGASFSVVDAEAMG